MRTLPPQFILWKLIQIEGKPKPDKIPVNPRGFKINHLDPRSWLTLDEAYNQASTNNLGIGFVFTKDDPYFFIDLDGCIAPDGNWTADAVDMSTAFAGAAIEISQSGKGLHIIGRCDPIAGMSRKNRLGEGQEFYYHDRFCAIGPYGFRGDFNADFTSLVYSKIPVRPPKEEMILTDGADPAYTGPEDDIELISLMLSSRGSLGQQFGSKASIRDLWYADPVRLAHCFPSMTGDVFDRSAADAALMAHLAFWTGRNLGRMDRIFRQSALMRDKYERRPEYKEWTVTNAARGCRNVYNVPRPGSGTAHVPQPGLDVPEGAGIAPVDVPLEVDDDDEGEVSDLSAGMPVSSTGIMMPTDQMVYFKGMVYIMEDHVVWIVKNDVKMAPERFSAFYGGATFMLDTTGRKSTKSAFEAFTQNNCLRFPKVEKSVFRPDRPVLERFGENSINVYVPEKVQQVQGDVQPFLTHIEKLFATERDRKIILYWFAAAVQYPHKKLRWAPVIQGVEGNGKSFLGEVLAYIIGAKHTHRPNAEDISNKFNDYIEKKLLIIVEEAHMQDRREMKDTLKPLITQSQVEVQPKGGSKRMTENWTRWIFFTNHRDAFPVDTRDRRYSIFFTNQQSREDLVRYGLDHRYFLNLWTWFNEGGGKQALAHYLHNVEIPDEFNATGAMLTAPLTSSSMSAITETMGLVEQILMEAIETQKIGFRGGWVSAWRLKELCRIEAPRIQLSPAKIVSLLANMGYAKAGRAVRPLVEENSEQPVLFSLNPFTDAFTDEFCKAQGYVASMPQPQNVVPFFKP